MVEEEAEEEEELLVSAANCDSSLVHSFIGGVNSKTFCKERPTEARL